MIYLTAIGLPPGGSSTAHIYTQTICLFVCWQVVTRLWIFMKEDSEDFTKSLNTSHFYLK
jgi:hypothetical protein